MTTNHCVLAALFLIVVFVGGVGVGYCRGWEHGWRDGCDAMRQVFRLGDKK